MSDLKKMAVKVKEPAMEAESTEEREVYPSLRFNGKEAAIIDLGECKYGEEYEIILHVKCTSIGGSNYPGSGNSEDEPPVEFDVLAASEPKPLEDSDRQYGDEEKEPKRKSKQRVVGPKEMGMDEPSEY